MKKAEYLMIEINDKLNTGGNIVIDEENKNITVVIWGTVLHPIEQPKKIGENKYQQRFENGLILDFSYSIDGKDLIIDYRFEDVKKGTSKAKPEEKKANEGKDKSDIAVELKDFMLHKTQRSKYNDKSGIKLAKDLEHHGKTIDEILKNSLIRNHMIFLFGILGMNKSSEHYAFNKKNLQATKKILELSFKSLIYIPCVGELDGVAKRIVEKFENNKVVSEFSDDTLTNIVKNHKSTTERLKFIRDEFNAFINIHIKNLKEKKEAYFKTIKLNQNNEFKYKTEKTIFAEKYKNINYLDYFLARNRAIPSYNGAEGLAVIIGSLWAYEIKVKYLRIYRDDTFDYELEIMFYDHFGVDPSDVVPNKDQNPLKRGMLYVCEGFSCWYLLQHLKDFQGSYTPLIVKMLFTYSKDELKNLGE